MSANTPAVPKSDKRKQGVPLNVYVPYDEIWLKGKIEEIAKIENRSVSEIMVKAGIEFVEKYDKKK